jgi:hypothetical protein
VQVATFTTLILDRYRLQLSAGKATAVAVSDKDLIPVIPAEGKEKR